MIGRDPWRGRSGAAALVAVLLVLAAACGSSSKSSSSSTTTSSSAGSSGSSGTGESGQPANWDPKGVSADAKHLKCTGKASDPTRGVTATSVKVGGLATLSNAGQNSFQDAIKGARARFDRQNAEGGVFGRRIDFVRAVDDQNSASANTDGARKLADGDKVFAVVPVATSWSAFADVLCKDTVPAFGWAINPGFCNNANVFGYTGCNTPDSEWLSWDSGVWQQLVKGQSSKTAALVGLDNEASRKGLTKYGQAMEHGGLDVVMKDYSLSFGAPPADLSPLVHKIMTADNGKPPALIFYYADFPNVLALTQAMKAAGYEGLQSSGVGYDPRLAEVKAFDDTYTILQQLSFQSTDNPVVKQMTADLKQYGDGAPLGLPAMNGWIAADMFVAALKATGKNLTVDSFLEKLNGGSFTYGDNTFIGKSYWPLNHVVGVPCSSVVRLHGGKYQVAVPLTCKNLFKAK